MSGLIVVTSLVSAASVAGSLVVGGSVTSAAFSSLRSSAGRSVTRRVDVKFSKRPSSNFMGFSVGCGALGLIILLPLELVLSVSGVGNTIFF